MVENSIDAMDFFGYVKLFDGLTDAAFYGKNVRYALGNYRRAEIHGPVERRDGGGRNAGWGGAVRDGPMERVSWALVGNAGLLWDWGGVSFLGYGRFHHQMGRGMAAARLGRDGVGARSYGGVLVFCFFQVSTIIFGHKIVGR